MRLIDADELIENIDEWLDHTGDATIGFGTSGYGEMMKRIEETPTAYDVDKVCREISEAKDIDNLVDCDHVIKIVKKGGKEDED